ncbi:hypothetical protein THIOSC15_2120020 [uncultured Thiomicrorhabdus sp.]
MMRSCFQHNGSAQNDDDTRFLFYQCNSADYYGNWINPGLVHSGLVVVIGIAVCGDWFLWNVAEKAYGTEVISFFW